MLITGERRVLGYQVFKSRSETSNTVQRQVGRLGAQQISQELQKSKESLPSHRIFRNSQALQEPKGALAGLLPAANLPARLLWHVTVILCLFHP